MKLLISAFFLLSAFPVMAAEPPFLIPDSVRQKIPKNLINVIQKAEDDYKAVQEGKWPIHAKFIDGSYTMDGGSRSFQGDRYKIIIRHRYSTIAEVRGVLYGPTLKFDDDIMRSDISNIRFYTLDELHKLGYGKIPMPKYQVAEQAGAGQPATKPADNPPVKDQPSTPTPKDGSR